MKPRRLATFVVTLLAVGSLTAGAHAGGSAGRPPGSPNLAAMALAVTDLPAGTRVQSQGYKRDPDFVASYEREFEVRGGRLGRSRVLFLFESLDVERSPANARLTFSLAAALLRGKQGAELLEAAVAEGAGATPLTVSVGKIRRPAIGHSAIVVPLRVKTSGIPFAAAIVFIRFDRILGVVALVGFPGAKVYPGDVDRISRVAVERMRAGLVPASVVAPTLSGTPQPGQVLTATRGGWTGDQLAFGYQWERCDTAGAACAAIPGTTGTTYTVATGDLASTVRVTVTGRNRLGTSTANSSATAVVAGPSGAPASIVVPVVSGSPQVGATLTVDTGTWTGDPTAFAYQWRRCDGSGGSCIDIGDATTQTYVVASTDSRSTLRVLVVATNAAGPGGAISAPTVAVP